MDFFQHRPHSGGESGKTDRISNSAFQIAHFKYRLYFQSLKEKCVARMGIFLAERVHVGGVSRHPPHEHLGSHVLHGAHHVLLLETSAQQGDLRSPFIHNARIGPPQTHPPIIITLTTTAACMNCCMNHVHTCFR